jgi:type VI secretion system protein ImpJ
LEHCRLELLLVRSFVNVRGNVRILQPVVWSKGVFVSPQHLQVQDRFVESLLQFRTEALSFRPWGFTRLQINQEALASGIFSIHQASGLFPDGLAFDIPDSDGAPPVKSLAEFFGTDDKSLTVSLAIPSYRVSGVNLSMREGLGDTRYLAQVTEFRDENSGGSEKPVQLARKNFRLVVEGEAKSGFVTLAAGRVLRDGGSYQLDPAFVPPLLNFAASEFLGAILRGLVETVSAKRSVLAGMRRQKNQRLADFTTADIAQFWLLYATNSHFPYLLHLFRSKHGHPEKLFAAMIALASTLTTFSLEIQPEDLPAYDHENLGECFAALNEKLLYLLETVVPSNFVSLPLKMIRPSIYATSIFEDRFLDNTKLYLAIVADLDEAELIRKAPDLIKICSANHIDHLIRQALPGVPLVHIPSPPTTIPIKLNHQYFSLNQSGVAWEAIGRARNLAVYVPGDIQNVRAELIVVLPQQ